MASAVISAPPTNRQCGVNVGREVHMEVHTLKPADYQGFVNLVNLVNLLACPH
jgi:hypothetical protein